MPSVSETYVKAIFCSDLHFSHKVPVARSVEEDWYEVQGGYLKQLLDLGEKHKAPIIVAGDIFDKWNAPVELTNYLIQRIHTPIYAIPGQHDLPHHSMEIMEKTAYWNLVCAGKIINIEVEFPQVIDNLRIWAFPWGTDLSPCPKDNGLMINIALVHKYIWKKGYTYPDAPEENEIHNISKKLKGYDVSVFGDNHKGFLVKLQQYVWLLNCGTFMRRKIDEKEYKPSVGLYYSSGEIKLYYLDTKKDKFLDSSELKNILSEKNFISFMEELNALTDTGINFEESLRKVMRDLGVSKNIRRIILECLE